MLFLSVLNIHLMKEVKEESTQKRKIVKRKKEKEMMMIEGKVGLNLMSFEAGVTAQLLNTIFLLF